MIEVVPSSIITAGKSTFSCVNGRIRTSLNSFIQIPITVAKTTNTTTLLIIVPRSSSK